jgi:hypothetical protein
LRTTKQCVVGNHTLVERRLIGVYVEWGQLAVRHGGDELFDPLSSFDAVVVDVVDVLEEDSQVFVFEIVNRGALLGS